MEQAVRKTNGKVIPADEMYRLIRMTKVMVWIVLYQGLYREIIYSCLNIIKHKSKDISLYDITIDEL